MTVGVDDVVLDGRLEFAERWATRISMLIQALPARLTDPLAMQRIADWLAEALEAQVLVSEPDRVLAASPDSAAEHLARVIIRKSVDGSELTDPRVSSFHTQLVSLAPAGGGDMVLAVASRAAFDEGSTRLLRHAAKLLGLVEQARRGGVSATGAHQAARTAVVELLLDGEPDKARRVMATLVPGLLEPDTARVLVIVTATERRDGAVQRCETAVGDRALVVADPRVSNRLLIINPVHSEDESASVAGDLVRVVTTLGPGTTLGGSGVYSMGLMADALSDALAAQRFATYQPDSVALSPQEIDLVSLLPQHDAHRWARALLAPLMRPDAQWEQLRRALPDALAYPYTVAAQRLALHRNTVMKRVATAARLLGMDLDVVSHRIAVGLALEIVNQRDTPQSPADLGGPPPSLPSLLAAPELADWADTLLREARQDRRHLLGTATTWLTHNTHTGRTARALDLSEVTVGKHLRALEKRTKRDLRSLSGLRDLQISLHITTGHPIIKDSTPALPAAA